MYPLESEDKKYSQLYDRNYGSDAGNNSIKTVLASWSNRRITLKNPSVIDYGCGRGQLRKFVPFRTYDGVDLASSQVARNTGSANISYHHGTIHECDCMAEVGYCIDVMEHVPEEFVDRTLMTMVACTDTLILSISCGPANCKSVEGEQLHCTVRTPEWWVDKLKQFTKVRDIDIQPGRRLLAFTGGNYEAPRVEEKRMGLLRIRETINGEYWIARRHRATEEYLDKKYERMGRQLRWRPRGIPGRDIEELRPLFEGKGCYYVGKGPSLDKLSAADFPKSDLPVIAINDAITKVETLGLPNKVFCLQGDASFKDGSSCSSAMFVQGSVSNFYPEVEEKYVYETNALKIPHGPGLLHAIMITRSLGCTFNYLLCFDAMASGDCGYAGCIGYGPEKGGDPKRFLDHRIKVLRYTDAKTLAHVTPTGVPSGTSSDTPQQ